MIVLQNMRASGFTASQQDNPAPRHLPYRTFTSHPGARSCKPLSKAQRGGEPSPRPDGCPGVPVHWAKPVESGEGKGSS